MRDNLFSIRLALYSAVLITTLFIFSTTSFAVIFTVTNLDDSGAGSLRQAIIDANDNDNNPAVDEIVFDLVAIEADEGGPPPWVLDLTTDIDIEEDLTITGPGTDVLTIDGLGNSRIFDIDDSDGGNEIVVSISGLRFKNGDETFGGAIYNIEDLSIDACVFDDNFASDRGGAIYNDEGAPPCTLNITNSTFSGNTADSFGGAIFNVALIENITDSTFSNNTADDGGAIFNDGLATDATIDDITNSTFSGNTATDGDGGAILNEFGLIRDITNSTFSANTAVGAGGAIVNSGGPLTIENITDCTFIGNSASFGGAIFNIEGHIATITNSTFSGNSVTGDEDNIGGGAIWNALATIGEITNSTFTDNITTLGNGGAIYNDEDSTITDINNSTFTGNNAGIDGGAIWNEGDIDNITNCTFSGNNANNNGGAIWNTSAMTIEKITNSTFSGNMAGAHGGAIMNDAGTILEITNTTFSGNSSGNTTTGSGGAINNTSGIISAITHSTFSGNRAGIDNDGGGGAIWSDGNIDNITNCTFSGNDSNSNGGAIRNNNATINVSFTTIANNEAGDDGGGVYESGGSVATNIRNSIVAFNTADGSGDNCNSLAIIGGDRTNNYSDDTSCGFDGDEAIIILGPLADNGGPTQTLALLGGDPLDGASAACDPLDDTGTATGVALPNDQRYFPRPFGPACDSGAYENGPSASVRIKKITSPKGGTGFVFTTTGFEELVGCGLQGDMGELVMDSGSSESCAVPFGDYTVTETIPEGQVLNIFCSEIPPTSTIDSDTGELSFSIINSQFDVNCLFINVTAQTLLNAMDEPPGLNCTEGGVKIEEGLDTNLNGVLDPDEVLSTFYVCNGLPGEEGPEGPEGPEGGDGFDTLINTAIEPPGLNCEFGGLKIETGLDLNRNGVLDPNEVQETAFVCNGANGEKGVKGGSDCSLAPVNSVSGPSTLAGLLIYMLIPAAIVIRRRRASAGKRKD